MEVRLIPAGPGRRFIALLLDASCAIAVAAALTLPLRFVLPPAALQAAAVTLSFVVGWGWYVLFEAFGQGRTPGKQLLGLRVVDSRGLPLTLEQALVRNVVRALDFAPVFYGLGAFVSQSDTWRRRLGDLAADTLVIRESREFEALGELRRSDEFNSLRTPRVLRLVRRRVSMEEAELLLALTLRADQLGDAARYDLLESVGRHYREKLELGELPISGRALVQGLASLVIGERRPSSRRLGSRR